MNQYTVPQDSLFRDRGVFELNYDPGPLRLRHEETREITTTVRAILKGKPNQNIFVRGSSGTGKTTVIHNVFSEIRQSDENFVPVYINCYAEQTLSQVFAKIFFTHYGQWPKPNAYTARELIDTVSRELALQNAVLIVCFEDADRVIRKYAFNEILSTMIQLNKQYPPLKVGIIITFFNPDIDPARYLDSRILSTFLHDEVVFHRYSKKEVGEILHNRVTAGLWPDTISALMLWHIVDATMPNGDIRAGLDLLKRAVMSAEQNGRCSVSEKDIEGLLMKMNPFETTLNEKIAGEKLRELETKSETIK